MHIYNKDVTFLKKIIIHFYYKNVFAVLFIRVKNINIDVNKILHNLIFKRVS